ncbi:MAG: hypothetical protein P8J33_01240, partial [Pirellulaceae bacterium]|nr:hypothetical protein [Pirellulaceae bacterium]
TIQVPRTVMMRVPVDMWGNPIQMPTYSTLPSLQSEIVTSRPIVSESTITEEPVRVDSARPKVELKEVPGSSKDVFPETSLKPESDLTTVAPKQNEYTGELRKIESDSGSDGQSAADKRPSLDSEKAAESDKDPGLDAPSKPKEKNQSDKLEDPLDT